MARSIIGAIATDGSRPQVQPYLKGRGRGLAQRLAVAGAVPGIARPSEHRETPGSPPGVFR